MRVSEERDFKKQLKTILFFGLGVFLYLPLSQASQSNPVLEPQTFAFQFSDTSSQEPLEGDLSSSLDSSSLNLKLELGGGLIYAFAPLLLEFQTPISGNFKWLVQTGAGGVYFPFVGGFVPFFPIDTGFRYHFQPVTLSLRGGVWFTLREALGNVEVATSIGWFIADFKAALSVGWLVADTVHVELSGGLFSIFHAGPFVSLAFSMPLASW